MHQWELQDAKARLSELVRLAAGWRDPLNRPC